MATLFLLTIAASLSSTIILIAGDDNTTVPHVTRVPNQTVVATEPDVVIYTGTIDPKEIQETVTQEDRKRGRKHMLLVIALTVPTAIAFIGFLVYYVVFEWVLEKAKAPVDDDDSDDGEDEAEQVTTTVSISDYTVVHRTGSAESSESNA